MTLVNDDVITVMMQIDRHGFSEKTQQLLREFTFRVLKLEDYLRKNKALKLQQFPTLPYTPAAEGPVTFSLGNFTFVTT